VLLRPRSLSLQEFLYTTPSIQEAKPLPTFRVWLHLYPLIFGSGTLWTPRSIPGNKKRSSQTKDYGKGPEAEKPLSFCLFPYLLPKFIFR
jgi:hypothetical protein